MAVGVGASCVSDEILFIRGFCSPWTGAEECQCPSQGDSLPLFSMLDRLYTIANTSRSAQSPGIERRTLLDRLETPGLIGYMYYRSLPDFFLPRISPSPEQWGGVR